MLRWHGTRRDGSAFSAIELSWVWSKARQVFGYNQAEWRYDSCGNLIRFGDYGLTNSKYGWEVDHIRPVSKGGNDDLLNLQPLQWQVNRKKGDTYPWRAWGFL